MRNSQAMALAKTISNCLLVFLVATLVTLSVGMCSAAPLAADDASDTAYDDGWGTGDNGGSGFGAWSLSNTGGNSGHFVGASGNNAGGSGNIDTGGRAWGAYANSGETADGTRPFSGPLSVGQTFSIAMDNGWIGGGTVGFGLQNSSSQNRLEYYFVGGSPNYTIQDNSGSVDSGLGFTGDGMTVAVTLTGANSYLLTIDGGTAITGTLANSGGIDRVRVFNFDAGSGGNNDAFFNSISIVPEPSSLVLVLLGLFCLSAAAAERRRIR